LDFYCNTAFLKLIRSFLQSINQFSKEDIKYVANLLNIIANEIDITQYKKFVNKN